MSSLSSVDPSLISGALPPINPAREPAEIRNGSPEAKKAYQVGLGFEDILVNQLSQELAKTVSSSSSSDGGDGGDGGSGDGLASGGSSGSAGGLLGSDPATSAFARLIPQALTTGIMSAGGLGIATRLAEALDPSIGKSQSKPGSSPEESK